MLFSALIQMLPTPKIYFEAVQTEQINLEFVNNFDSRLLCIQMYVTNQLNLGFGKCLSL